MINFTYHNPTKIVFGKDQVSALSDLLKPYKNQTILLVYGRKSLKTYGIYDEIMNHLKPLNIKVIEESDVRPNPDLKSVLSGRKKVLEHNVKFILAAGGGSVIDCAKAIAFSVSIDEDKVWDVFLRKAEAKHAIPLGTVLTLSAAGSESNGNTVITNEDTKEKRAVSYPFIYPVFSIIDPSYTMHVDKHFVVAGGIDVIMHVFEQYFSNTLRTETSDYMSFGIIKSVIENVNRYLDGEDSYDTRANLSWAATIGLNWILGQGKVGDWATHRLSYPITQFYRITHGYALTTIYPAWLRLALKENPETMERRLTFLGKEVFNKKTAEDTILAIKDLFDSWDAPTSFKDGQVYLDGDAVRELAKNATALGSVGTIVEIDYKKAIELFEDAKE